MAFPDRDNDGTDLPFQALGVQYRDDSLFAKGESPWVRSGLSLPRFWFPPP
ncbi:hypothetical protein ACX0GZ_10000 [Sphingomonas aestuarii]